MLFSFESFNPCTKIIKGNSEEFIGVKANKVMIDFTQVKGSGCVWLLYCDESGQRIPFYKCSSADNKTIVDELGISGWHGAWLEIVTWGFFELFFCLDFSYITATESLENSVLLPEQGEFKQLDNKRRVK